MRTPARNTRRTSVAQPPAGKENHSPSQQANPTTSSPRKPRSRLSAAELARLEDVFKQDTHPTRQQKRDIATELGMDCKTVTIWFQNKRQTAKRGQVPGEKPEQNAERPRTDSCLRTVSSPSHNATLSASSPSDSGSDYPTADAVETKSLGDSSNTMAAKAIVKIKPLLDSLSALTSRSRGHTESIETRAGAPNVRDAEPHGLQTSLEIPIASVESNRENQTVEQEKAAEKTVRWKRIRTLEWACERQTKRRRVSKDAYARLGSEEAQESGTRMDSALSLLSLASSTQVQPPNDVMRGASLLLSFKHSWRRK